MQYPYIEIQKETIVINGSTTFSMPFYGKVELSNIQRDSGMNMDFTVSARITNNLGGSGDTWMDFASSGVAAESEIIGSYVANSGQSIRIVSSEEVRIQFILTRYPTLTEIPDA